VFNKFYNDIKNGQALPIYGNPSRDFIYVDDLVAGILQGTNAEANKGEIFHLSSGTETKIIDFARLMHEAYGSKNNFEVQQKSERLGEVKNNSASHTKARNAFGFKCNHTLKEAIQKTVEWYKDNSL
jgi:dTDP-L-rhamnose 4-epimerase